MRKILLFLIMFGVPSLLLSQTAGGAIKRHSSNIPPQNNTVNKRGRTQFSTSSNKYKTFEVKGVTFRMVYVEGGTYIMGGTLEQGNDAEKDENPIHEVTLSPFYIGETEVTQALWEVVMLENPSDMKGYNLPVESVNWYNCQKFIDTLNSLTGQTFRFLTESEWEYAARGGNKSRKYKYSGSNDVNKVAWHSENSGGKTHPVKTKEPNELGLYDMSGNVDEWCVDWYGDYQKESQTNPIGPQNGSFRVLRGGSFFFGPESCRLSSRSNNNPGYYDFYPGLRLALSAPRRGGVN